MNARCRRSTLLAMLTLVFVLLPGMAAVAAGKAAPRAATGNIADRWVLWSKPGQEKQLEAAIKTHAAWRKQAGEPFAWSTYQPIAGTDLTYYVVRSAGHQWKDFDAEQAWAARAGAEAAYDRQVAPYVARVEHNFEETDTAHSQLPEDLKDYRYFSVTTRQLRPGSRGQMMGAVDKIQQAITAAKWPYPYALAWLIGGADDLRIIEPMKSYADMADPDPSLRQVLAKSLGQDNADATLKQFGSSFEGGDTTIYVYRPDLSTQK